MKLAQTQHTVEVIYDVIGSHLPTVHRRLIVEVNALADFDDNGFVVGLFDQLSASALFRVYRGAG